MQSINTEGRGYEKTLTDHCTISILALKSPLTNITESIKHYKTCYKSTYTLTDIEKLHLLCHLVDKKKIARLLPMYLWAAKSGLISECITVPE